MSSIVGRTLSGRGRARFIQEVLKQPLESNRSVPTSMVDSASTFSSGPAVSMLDAGHDRFMLQLTRADEPSVSDESKTQLTEQMSQITIADYHYEAGFERSRRTSWCRSTMFKQQKRRTRRNEEAGGIKSRDSD